MWTWPQFRVVRTALRCKLFYLRSTCVCFSRVYLSTGDIKVNLVRFVNIKEFFHWHGAKPANVTSARRSRAHRGLVVRSVMTARWNAPVTSIIATSSVCQEHAHSSVAPNDVMGIYALQALALRTPKTFYTSSLLGYFSGIVRSHYHFDLSSADIHDVCTLLFCFSYEFNVYKSDDELTYYFIRMTMEFFQECNLQWVIDQFRYFKIQPKTKDLSTRLWGVTTEFVGFIPQCLVLRSIV